MKMKSKKREPRFEELLKKTVTVDEAGNLKVKGMYASTYINFGFDGGIISVPVSHIVWFLTRGRWPDDDKHIDHRDDDSMNSAPNNLQELTPAQNHEKRRGRQVYRSYGKGKYGPGINIHLDKRDGHYYARHQASRGHGNGDLKNVRTFIGRFKTLDDAKTGATVWLTAQGLA